MLLPTIPTKQQRHPCSKRQARREYESVKKMLSQLVMAFLQYQSKLSLDYTTADPITIHEHETKVTMKYQELHFQWKRICCNKRFEYMKLEISAFDRNIKENIQKIVGIKTQLTHQPTPAENGTLQNSTT